MLKSLLQRVFVGLLALAYASLVSAELATPLTLDEKIAAADAIVHARCVATTTEWRNGKVFTIAQFEVLDDLRAGGLAQLELVNAGGTAVHPVLKVPVTTRVSDAVPISNDDEVILFARRFGQEELRVLAGSQGYVKVDRDTGGAAHVRTVERRVVATPARGDQASGARLEQAAYSLDQFKQRIRARLGAAKKELP